MSENEYEKMIDDIVVPESLSDTEKGEKYKPLINYLDSNTPEKLFRFRSCSERAFAEFDKDVFGFSPAFKMNDDFDGMLYFDKEHIKSTLLNLDVRKFIDLIQSGDIPETIKRNIPNEILNQLINNILANPTKDIVLIWKQLTDFVIEDYDDNASIIGKATQNQKIACLSQKVESAAMWGYYANNGTGFALAYDLREKNNQNHFIFPMIYGKNRIDGTEYAEWLLQQQTLQSLLKVFCDSRFNSLAVRRFIPCPDLFMSTKVLIHKANCWKHEEEWRGIYYEKENENIEFPFIIQKPTAVYLGRNISEINEKIICQIASEKQLPIYKMEVRDDSISYYLFPKRL